jgi:hypothetical protein
MEADKPRPLFQNSLCLGTYKELLLQLRNNPKVMVIKDVIKELSKVQKDQGTLVHEIVSENCFTFFSEAMKIARDKDLLGTIHILLKHIFRSFEPLPS